ncbi:MAG: peptidase C39 family protein [Verrucomicrobia bacterium]|nr:peptidase C39 family protein [Verrucomicrobiota bacterium]
MTKMKWFGCSLGFFPIAFVVPAAGGAAGEANPIHFIGLQDFTSFEQAPNGNSTVLTSPWFSPPLAWNELIVSWNAMCPPGSHLKIEARAADAKAMTPFYVMGLWSPDPARHPRESVKGQKDDLATVKTDTLLCRRKMDRVQVRLTLGGDRELPTMKFLGVCVQDTGANPAPAAPNRAAWGRIVDVPQRSQLGYPGGSGWCSPTSISMLLAHWSRQLKRPELDVSVPDVARAVHDRNWTGTGNWPFNTAFAGQFAGMRAYVTQVADLREVEDWIAAGIPVAVSVSFDLLNGKSSDQGTGHLILVVGFTNQGDIVVNDPWPNPKRENSVRKIFPRANLLKAWERSHHTIYLVYPESAKIPANRYRHWAE